MKDSPLRLQDKTVLLAGPFVGLTQTLLREFTEQGADVGFVNHEAGGPARFIDNVNDAREVHAQFGRAAQIAVNVIDQKTAFDATTKVAEIFGRIDVYVDFTKQIELSRLFLNEVTPFFKSKKRGRVIFVRDDEAVSHLLEPGTVEEWRGHFDPWIDSLVRDWPSPGFGINSVSLGLTEDLLLKKFPKGASIRQSLEEVQKTSPNLRLVDAAEVASVVLFLSSQMASGITNQNLRVARF